MACVTDVGRLVEQYGHHNKPLTQTAGNPGRADQHALCCARFPDPETPVGARGVGEPPVGARLGSVLSAIADAAGDSDQEFIDNLKPVSGFGVTGRVDGDTAHAVVRLTTD